MKLAIVRQKYTPYGGAERFVALALDALRSQGVTVEVIAREWQGEAAGVRCDPFYLGRTLRDMSFARCVRRVIDSGRYDLVQSHERIPGCHIFRAGDGVHRAWLERRARQLGSASRAWLQLSLFNRYTLAAEESVFRSQNLRVAICISELVKRDIQTYFGLDDDRLPVIYNGVDTHKFSPALRQHRASLRQQWGVPEEAPLFLFVGSGFERKGLASLLTALPKQAWLLVVGKDKHEKAYRRLAVKLGIDRRVRFVGPQRDVLPFYGAADAFAFPTIYEPFGNVILEAMASGLPVVTTPDCGAAELLIEGQNGFVRATGDREGLGEALNRLCDVALARQLGANAAAAAQGYNLEGMAERLIALYSRLLLG